MAPWLLSAAAVVLCLGTAAVVWGGFWGLHTRPAGRAGKYFFGAAPVGGALAPPAAAGEPAFRFHIYPIPDKYIGGALAELERNWNTSVCNRNPKRKTSYTLLDWRHAHSLFTVDTFIARFLRRHPRRADLFIIPAMTHLYNCAGHMG
eukprot:gene30861-2289_t